MYFILYDVSFRDLWYINAKITSTAVAEQERHVAALLYSVLLSHTYSDGLDKEDILVG